MATASQMTRRLLIGGMSLLSVVVLLLLFHAEPALAQNPQLPVANHTQSTPNILPIRRYPFCAYDIHTNATTPRMFYTAGQNGSTTTAQNGDTYVSVDGWTSSAGVIHFDRQPIVNTGAPFVVRRAGGMVHLANGNLVMFGGKTVVNGDANVYEDLVYYSPNYGKSWWQATHDAAWTDRSDMAYCAIPGTNRILMCGGQVPSGGDSECWTSTDGIGREWTMQSTGQFSGFSGGTCVALYDSTLFGGMNENHTLLLIAPTGPVYQSHDFGVTFTRIATVPFATTSARNFLNAVADRMDDAYVFGGQGTTDSNVYYSPDDGYTWYVLSAVAGNANNFILMQASTSCMAIMLTPVASSSQSTRYYIRELVVYGGQLTLSNGEPAESTRITLSGVPIALPSVWPEPLPTYDQSLMPVANHTQSTPNILPIRRYPFCAYDIHTNATTPRMFYTAGQNGSTTTAQNGDTYVSVDGWTSSAGVIHFDRQPIVNTGAPFVVRRAGGMVHLANGNLVMFGGKTVVNGDANVYEDLVYYSPNYGKSWWQATHDAAWTDRSDMAYCAIPGTNRILMCGGQVPSGGDSECWTSTDGIGREWTMQSTGQFSGFSGGTCVALYDSTLFGGMNENHTLLLIAPTGPVYQSHDFGVTFTRIATVPFATTSARNFLNAVADRMDDAYVFGGQGTTDSNVYYSPDDGYSWYILQAVPGNANSFVLLQAYTSCMAMVMTPIETSSQGTQYYIRELVVYGGRLNLSNGEPAESTRITLSGVPITLRSTWPEPLPPFEFNSTLPFANHTQSLPGILPIRRYPSCAYDIHSSDEVPRMWLTAGQNGSTTTAQNSDTFMTTDGWTSLGGVTHFPAKTIVNTGTPFLSRRAGGMVYLANGNLVMFGGKTVVDGDANVYEDMVYYSPNQGQSWWQVTDDAEWTDRSDMAYCAIPGTNRIMMCGGQLQGGGLTSECWTSTDGVGLHWELQSIGQTEAFQSGTCAGMYDSALFGGAQRTSTLVVISNRGNVYTSTNYAVTLTRVGVIPFWPAVNRNGLNLVVDRSNNLYVVGGQNVIDGDVYYSPDYGVSWYTLFPLDNDDNGGVLSKASTSCMAMWFARQSRTETTQYYDRTLVVYGGEIALADDAVAESVQITLSNAPVILPAVWPSPLPPYTPDLPGSSSSSSKTSGLTGGAIAGIVIGVLVVVIVAAVYIRVYRPACCSGIGGGSTLSMGTKRSLSFGSRSRKGKSFEHSLMDDRDVEMANY